MAKSKQLKLKRSPMALTAEYLRTAGYVPEGVERFVRTAKGGFKKDLLGIVDVIGYHHHLKPLAVQTTSASNASARVKKAMEERGESIRLLLSHGANHAFEIHGWGRSAKDKLHYLNRYVFTIDDGGEIVVTGGFNAERLP